MEKFVEFYFPGRIIEGENERKVVDCNIDNIKQILPNYAIAFRFFEKDKGGNKVNISNRYWIGRELSVKDLNIKYPQIDPKDFDRLARTAAEAPETQDNPVIMDEKDFKDLFERLYAQG